MVWEVSVVLVRGPRQDLEVEEAFRVSVESLEKEKHKVSSQCRLLKFYLDSPEAGR